MIIATGDESYIYQTGSTLLCLLEKEITLFSIKLQLYKYFVNITLLIVNVCSIINPTLFTVVGNNVFHL